MSGRGRTECARPFGRCNQLMSNESATGPRSILRRIGGPLLLYHILILVGAYLIVLGFIGHTQADQFAGWVLVAVGVCVEGAVVWWSATLTKRAAGRASLAKGIRLESLPRTDRTLRWLCVRCGQDGIERSTVCPRCGGPVVRSPRLDGQDKEESQE